jgi:hypothetical protein
VAKRGLFTRILDRVFGRPEPAPPPPPPRVPPGGGGALPGGGEAPPPGEGRKDPFREVWNTEVSKAVQRDISNRSGNSRTEVFHDHLTLFLSLPGMTEEERDQQLLFWHEYLQTFVMGRDGKAGRTHFLHDVGLRPKDFSWDEWRRAMDYRVRG